MKKALLILYTILLAKQSYTQEPKGMVKGIVLEYISNQPISNASISISKTKYASPLTKSLTTDSGIFLVQHLDTGTYNFTVSHQGYEPFYKSFSITKERWTADLHILKLEKAYKTLSEVVVKDKTPIRVKGDTTSYNAAAFKARPNASAEDLLKKLPGIQVGRTGDVSAQGEQVQKIYVDGKEYFGEGLEQATKNLTADMIDQVQVFDDKSEGAKFSGIDDGSRSKAINLKLKKEKKQGVSGKAYAGHGPGGEYNAGIRSNYFKGASQLSLIAFSNNINRTGSTVSELSSAGNSVSGLTKASSFGINYRDTWSKSIDVNGSYSFNNRNNTSFRQSFRQTFLSHSTLFTNRQTDYTTINSNHRFNQKIIYTIDSLNSIIYTPILYIQRSRSSASDSLTDFTDDSLSAYKSSDSRTANIINGHGYTFTNNIIWRRKFNRKGRTFSANVNSSLNGSERNSFNRISSQFYTSTGAVYRQRNTDFERDDKNGAGNYTLALSYTEPLTKSSLLEVNYSNGRSRTSSDRRTNGYNILTGQYDEPDDTLTNNFQQVTKFNRVGANFRAVKTKYNYQVGLSVQQSLLTGNNISNKTDITQRYTNIIPTLSFNYQLARNRNLRMSYRGRNNQPTILQLQDLPDLGNYPYIRRGNPGLQQEFTHNLMLNYNFYNTAQFRNVYASLLYYSTRNKIVNALQISDGEQVLTPVNVDGVYSINGSFGYSIPFNRMEGGNLSTITRLGYHQNAGFVNGEKNLVKNLQLGEDIHLSFTYKDNLDLNMTTGLTLNSLENTIQKAQNSFYLTYNYSFDLAYTFPHHLMLSTVLDYTGVSGRDTDLEGNYLLWSASLTRPVLKNKKGELTFSIHNLLNQNNNIARNVFDNVIEDVQNQTQGRFALLTFTYNLNRLIGNALPGKGPFKSNKTP